MQNMLLSLSYVPFVYLIYIYAGHGVEGFTEPENFFEVISTLGFPALVTTFLVYTVSILDMFVAVVLVAHRKIAPSVPMLFIYLWCGLWPWVPRILELYGGMEPEISNATYVTIAALVAYIIHTRYHHEN